MRINTLSIIALGLLLCTSTAWAQSPKAYAKKAKQSHQKGDWAASLSYHRLLLEIDENRVDAMYRAGEAALFLGIYGEAAQYLEKIPASAKTGDFIQTDFYLATAKKGMGNYDEAIGFYQKYLESQVDSSLVFYKIAKEEIAFCAQAKTIKQTPVPVEIVPLGDNINSYFPDFAPLRYADKLYFSSTRPDKNNHLATRIFAAIQDYPARPIEENPAENTTQASHLSLSADAKRMYYTLCNEAAASVVSGCEIWYRDKKYEGDWDSPKRLPRTINLPGYTVAQPAIGWDKFLQKNVLYFASNRPGGAGGMDIWYSIEEAGDTFSEPVLLPFNSSGDETTPYFHQQSQTLFFSSNGLGGLGGFDLYRAAKTEKETWSQPVNLGYPINTSYDESHYTFHKASGTAYFASNRPGSRCAEPQRGCPNSDLFEASIRATLLVQSFSASDSSLLTGVGVELLNLESGQRDTFTTGNADNQASMPLVLGKNYLVTASKEHYSHTSTRVSTEEISYPAILDRQLYLPKGTLIVRTYHAIDSLPLYEAAIELKNPYIGRVLFVQNDARTHSNSFTLTSSEQLVLRCSRPDFTNATDTLTLNSADTVYHDVYLSPFGALPLSLFFDNAMPTPAAESPLEETSQLNYEEAYRAYTSRKAFFLDSYTAGLKGIERSKAQSEMLVFFADSVEANYERLPLIFNLLETYLKAGKRLEVLLTGHASPLASAEYNRRLIARRLDCVVNYFKSYKKGIFMPFIRSGSLVFRFDSKSSAPNAGDYNTSTLDRRLTVFSPQASALRKVTIADIRPLPPRKDNP